jgi:hypothetical protein
LNPQGYTAPRQDSVIHPATYLKYVGLTFRSEAHSAGANPKRYTVPEDRFREIQ